MSYIPERPSRKKSRRFIDELMAEATNSIGVRATASIREQLDRRQLQCAAKLSFRSKASVVKWIRAHPRCREMVKVVPYKCDKCEQWHTTKAYR